MDPTNAIAWLGTLVRDPPRSRAERYALGLGPIRDLLERLGDPHHDLECIHIAGSKGKGSTALLAEAIAQAAGLETGTFTSPHLERWTERYRIGGREIASDRLAELLTTLRPHVDDALGQDAEHGPSFFDVLTAGAFVLFRDAGVECAILEAGIGGRLDATNVARARATCITSIELEHTDKLGDTIEAIATEKAGIIKPSTPLVVGDLPRAASRIIRSEADSCGAPMAELGDSIRVARDTRVKHGIVVELPGLTEPLPATMHHPTTTSMHNAALALACVHATGLVPPDRLRSAAGTAIGMARLPGRLEVIGERPWVVVDGAHTAASVSALCELLRELPATSRHLVFSITSDKPVLPTFEPLLRLVDEISITQAVATRSLDARQLAETLKDLGPTRARLRVVPDPKQAIVSASRATPADGLLCIGGSMYLAGLGRQLLGASADDDNSAMDT